MNVRPAAPDDAMAVARVHVRAWQAAYRGLMPAEFLQSLRPEDRAQHYNFTRLDPAQPRTLVAVEADTVLGFATISPARDADVAGWGELCALYVEPDCWGRGFGQALVSAARADLCGLGFRQAVLWVVAGNARAERFYRADGWTQSGLYRPRPIWNVTVQTRRYSRALEALA
ncbi:MAG TPA: GNAT family N-acetyltransferase [Steroidobacteraceae bacterium]|jgi:GNAT superfamily N-acetyltransferase|nr:GNAT family N-acetyltransferase [Steroidobacteraceae bacterium]